MFNITEQTLSEINLGHIYSQKDVEYPIRPKKKNRKHI